MLHCELLYPHRPTVLILYFTTVLSSLIMLVLDAIVYISVYYTCVVEYVPSTCFIERFWVAANVLVGPCCPAPLYCIDVDVYMLYYWANKMMMVMMMM